MNQSRQKVLCATLPDLPHGTFLQASQLASRNAALLHAVPCISSKLHQPKWGEHLAPFGSGQGLPRARRLHAHLITSKAEKVSKTFATGAGCSRHLDLAPLGHQSGSSAPTAHSKSAQGNALGTGNPQDVALKGRTFFGAFWAALSGLVVNGVGTQGVALGWHRVAPSGRQSTGARGAGCQSAGVRVMGRQSTGAGGAVSCVSGKFKYGKSFKASATRAGCSRYLFTPRPARCLATFTAFANQQISRLATVPFLPVARLVLACVAFVAPSVVASACGVSWSRPMSPMDSDYKFQLWEKLGEFPIGERDSGIEGRIVVSGGTGSGANAQGDKNQAAGEKKLPIFLGFNPSSNFPSLLGVGWSLALFDSRIEWQDSNTAILVNPDGNTVRLQRESKKSKTLKNGSWIAEISGKQMTCKASCGWVLVFIDNRLGSMRTPNGTLMEFVIGADRSRSWVANGRTLVSLKPDFDKTSTKKYYLLKFGKESIRLNMGTRPVVVVGKTKGNKKQTEKLSHEESLVSIESDGKTEKKFNFRPNEMLADKHLYRWEKTTHFLEQDGDNKFSFVTISGIKCIKAEVDGKTFLEGYDENRKVSQYNGGQIFITESIYLSESFRREVPRRVFTIGPDGKERLVQQFWYDENGKIIKSLDNSDGTEKILMRRGNEEILKNNKTGEQIWRKEYDSQDRIINFQLPRVAYSFEYSKDATLVKMTRKDKDSSSTVQIPILKATKLIERLGSFQNNDTQTTKNNPL